MLQRCYNEKSKGFQAYGARGIKACEFIRASPLNLVLLIGERPSRHLTLDRINNSSGYHCGTCAECMANGWVLNVRWATAKQQSRNMKNNRLVTINGVTRCVAEWIEITGIPRTSFCRKYIDTNLWR